MTVTAQKSKQCKCTQATHRNLYRRAPFDNRVLAPCNKLLSRFERALVCLSKNSDTVGVTGKTIVR